MVKVVINLDDDQAQKQLSKIIQQLKKPKPLFGILGEQLKKDHRQRFSDQQSPEGKKWQPLSPSYAARKHKGRGQILVARGQLRNTLAYNYDETKVEFGSGLKYARIHQFGGKAGRGKKVNIPARPWLGLSEQNKNVLLEKARAHLQAQFNK